MIRIMGALIFSCLVNFAYASEHNIEEYKTIIQNGSWAEKVAVYKTIYNYSGITSEGLYDLIVKEIENKQTTPSKLKPDQEEFNWSLKALAASGNLKYKPVLMNVARTTTNTKTKRHAVMAAERLTEFGRWNPVMNSNQYENTGRTKEEALRMRYLTHGDYEMANMAVSLAYKSLSFKDREFVNLVKTKLTEIYPQKTSQRYKVQFQSWACKYLMLDDKADEHRALIAKIARTSPNQAVKRWAKKSL